MNQRAFSNSAFRAIAATVIASGVTTVALADDKDCSVATLDGLYLFSATGYSVPASGPAQSHR